MSNFEKKSFDHPEQTKNIGRVKVDSFTMGALNFARDTASPGWRWSIDIKPVAKTESCQVNHLIYVVSGKIHVRMDDGKEMEFNAGDMASIPAGHDGWSVGDQPAVWLELPRSGADAATFEKKSFDYPEQTKNIGRVKVESLTMGTQNFARDTATPGWRWSIDVKPVAKTESCQVNHLIYVVSGKIKVRMDDGKEMEFNSGDMGSIPPGHDGWTVGDQPAVWFELPH